MTGYRGLIRMLFFFVHIVCFETGVPWFKFLSILGYLGLSLLVCISRCRGKNSSRFVFFFSLFHRWGEPHFYTHSKCDMIFYGVSIQFLFSSRVRSTITLGAPLSLHCSFSGMYWFCLVLQAEPFFVLFFVLHWDGRFFAYCSHVTYFPLPSTDRLSLISYHTTNKRDWLGQPIRSCG